MGVDDHNTNKVEVDDVQEDRWSQLPTLLLWMIKDRLNFVDNGRLAFVCKNWNSMSLCYPPPPAPQHQSAIPWSMYRSSSSTVCEFVNLSTKEKLFLDLPEIRTREFLFSRRGWLLFRDYVLSRPKSLLLINLRTNAKIIMPDPGGHVMEDIASFSSFDDGDDTPLYVVFTGIDSTRRTFYIANVHDKKWTTQSYDYGRKAQRTASLLVCGHKVYCLDNLGGLLIFDIASLVWRDIPGSALRLQWFIMETEKGDILKIDQGNDFKTFSFHKFIDSKSAWEELNDDNIEDRNWFIYAQNNHFTVKKMGLSKKIYKFAWFHTEVHYPHNPFLDSHYPHNRNSHYPHNPFLVVNPSVHVYDLTNGSSQSYPHREGEWIDLGWMDKVPCSCKRYVPPPTSMHC